jgi:hypothetical protein
LYINFPNFKSNIYQLTNKNRKMKRFKSSTRQYKGINARKRIPKLVKGPTTPRGLGKRQRPKDDPGDDDRFDEYEDNNAGIDDESARDLGGQQALGDFEDKEDVSVDSP